MTSSYEPTLRRNGMTKRNAAPSLGCGMESMEKGKAHGGTSNGDDINGRPSMSPSQRRQRRINGTTKLGRMWRRIALHMKRQPRSTQRLCALLAVAVLFIGLLLTVSVCFLIHQKLIRHNPNPSIDVIKAKAKGINENLHKAFVTPSKVGAAYNLVASRNKDTNPALHGRNSLRRKNQEIQIPILISSFSLDGAIVGNLPNMHVPPQLGHTAESASFERDYGGLTMEFFVEDLASRNIYIDHEQLENDFRHPEHERDDDVDGYYAVDDDVYRGEYLSYEEEGQGNFACRRFSEHKNNSPNCNKAHEYDWIETRAKYLAAGSYREVLSLRVNTLGKDETTIIKQLSYDHDVNYKNFEFVRMDAIVADLLTYHPLIFDIYGFCGLALMTEYFPHGDLEMMAVPDNHDYEEMHEKSANGVVSYNEFTPEEKLDAAIAMAESLAVLHGYKNGVIVHDDVQLAQYLYNADMSVLKLNDFNRAEFMLYDEASGKYCKYKNGAGGGTWRAQEEYNDYALNEKIDVFSYGNNVFSVLTGTWPFYGSPNADKEWTDKDIKHMLADGEVAVVDQRWKDEGPIEKGLVEVIERCWVADAEHRASIFEICEMLWKVREEVKTKGENA